MTAQELRVLNPYTGEEVGRVPAGGAAEIDDAVQQAKEGARQMRALPLYRRSEILTQAGLQLRAEMESLARLIVSEAGKTIREARAEVIRAAMIFQIAAEETRRLHGETQPFDGLPGGEGRIGYWTREPVGIVGAITRSEE